MNRNLSKTFKQIPAYQNSACRIVAFVFLLAWLFSESIDATEQAAELSVEAKPITEEQLQFFEKRIRPVLVKHCYECHSADSDEVAAEFMLDSRSAMMAGGEMGAAIIPGKPDKSLLLNALKYDDLEMPPDQKLPENVIADFERWIEMGAPDPREISTKSITSERAEFDWNKAREFWSFKPIQSQELPTVNHKDWPTNRIDHFVLRRMEAADLVPNPEADHRTLIRRASFDITGLPPTIDEVEQFVADKSDTAYEELVDRLLASNRYGEHRARMWLDLARYAEDQAHIVGGNKSLFYPNAYLYRDWVIESLNDDIPYNDFVRKQLAADFLTEEVKEKQPVSPEKARELVPLGFMGLGPKYYRRNDPQVMGDEWEDRIDVVSRTFLGITVACARCHDHKFDPVSTEDYYALAGVFASTEMHNMPMGSKQAESKTNETKEEKQKEKAKEKAPEESLHIVRDKNPHDVNLLIRGDANSKGEVVRRGFLTILNTSQTPEKDAADAVPEAKRSEFTNGSGRLELADAIVDPRNPLTARVIVNRIWDAMIGQPLVATTSNFGAQGAKPTHPELLDDLAHRFMENGWSLKWLQREIALSATYQLSSVVTVSQEKIDPENRLLSRANRKRLSIEQWRDALLSASGNMDQQIGGKSISPADPKSTRRTIYSRISRYELDRLLAMFDFPDPNNHSARRNQTISPLQKMFIFNSPFMVAQADRIVEQIREEESVKDNSSVDAAHFVRQTYRRLLSRQPSDGELEIATEFIQQQFAGKKSSADPLHEFVQTLMASNEFHYVD